MSEIRELAQKELQNVTVTNADTKSGDIATGLFGQVWMDRVLSYAQPLRRFKQLVRVNEELVGTGNDTAHIPVTTDVLDISVSMAAGDEGTGRTYTKMDKENEVSIEISSDDFYKGGIALAKEAVMRSKVDLVKQARYHVANSLAQDMDTKIRDVLVGVTNNVDVSTSGTITPDAFNEAMKKIESNNYVPDSIVISPSHQYDLRGDSQFTNASEYGSDAVIRNGQIGDYLGVDVLTSTNVSSKAVMVGTKRDGEKVSAAVAIKERPSIGYEYDRDEAEHRIFYDQAFKPKIIEGDAVCTVQTA